MNDVTKGLLEALKAAQAYVCGPTAWTQEQEDTLVEAMSKAIARAEASLAEPQPDADGPWKLAVIDQLVIAHILTAEHESDPLKAIQDLLAYHTEIAVDPRVSGAAAGLVEQAKAEADADSKLACALHGTHGAGHETEWVKEQIHRQAESDVLSDLLGSLKEVCETFSSTNRLWKDTAVHVMAQRSIARAEAALAEPQPDADGWIPWAGGECPVLNMSRVDVVHRNGDIFLDRFAGYAQAKTWTHDDHPRDIIAYRVVEAQP